MGRTCPSLRSLAGSPLAKAELLPVIEVVMIWKLNEEPAANDTPNFRP